MGRTQGTKQTASQARRQKGKGGRPRVRTGDEAQVTIEFPQLEYARLCAYVEHCKAAARVAKEPVAAHSKKEVLLSLWRAYWDSLPATERATILRERTHQAKAKRGAR